MTIKQIIKEVGHPGKESKCYKICFKDLTQVYKRQKFYLCKGCKLFKLLEKRNENKNEINPNWTYILYLQTGKQRGNYYYRGKNPEKVFSVEWTRCGN